MKHKILIFLSLLSICSVSFADTINLSQAIERLPIKAENKLQRQIDLMDMQLAVDVENGNRSYTELIKEYDLADSQESALQRKIASEISVEKTAIGNQMKDLQYNLEENVAQLKLRAAYVAALSAKMDTELKQLHLEAATRDYQLAEVQYQRGDITSADFEVKKIALNNAEIEKRLADVNYKKFREELNAMVGAEVLIAPEAAQTVDLADLDYYKSKAGNNIRVRIPQLKNEMIQLETPFYENRYLQKNPRIARANDDLWRDYDFNKLDVKAARLEIEQDIDRAYTDVSATILKVKNLETDLNASKDRLVQMEQLEKSGTISQKRVYDFKIEQKKLENAYLLSAFDLNSKRQALMYSISIGPLYQESYGNSPENNENSPESDGNVQESDGGSNENKK